MTNRDPQRLSEPVRGTDPCGLRGLGGHVPRTTPSSARIGARSDESRFWFHDGMHWPEPYFPFDALMLDNAVVAFNQASSRLFVVPPSLGVECRLLNGYVYLSANSVTDEATLARTGRAVREAGRVLLRALGRALRQLAHQGREGDSASSRPSRCPTCPRSKTRRSSPRVAAGDRATPSWSHTTRLLESFDLIWQYHFELLNLGYGAYLDLYELCRQARPGIDDQTIAKMVSGIDVLLWRPDDELRRLARLAVELGRCRGREERAQRGGAPSAV